MSFCGYQQTDSKLYMEVQNTQSSPQDTESEEQSRGADTTRIHNLV